MFRSQSIKHTITAGAVALAFVFSSSAMAGQPEGKVVPGKPGPDNIVEIAMAVNGLLGEFDYLLGAVGCLTDAEGNNAVVDLLSGSAKYTLFAPTDEAFEALQGALGITEPSSCRGPERARRYGLRCSSSDRRRR